MRYVSLFSGVEAATLAWEPLGWEPLAFAEVEPFPSAVLAHRWPGVPNLGDVTKVDWREYRGTADLVVGGSPCQAFSVAGRRQGLMDQRGQLMLEYVRAVAEIEPRWFVWENVPGVLSQDRGRAFGTLLREMDELGYGMAWRVLDAQFFGVAQRRRRVFLVGRAGGGGGEAAAVLFEPESLRWDTPSSKAKREALAADAGRGSSGTGGGTLGFAQNTRDEVRIQGDGTISGALAAQPGMKQQTFVMTSDCLTPWDVQSKRIYQEHAVGPTLPSGTTQGVNIQPIVMASGHSHAEIGEHGITPTLTAHNQKDAPVVIDRAAFNQGQNAQFSPHIEQTELMDTLVARGPHAIGCNYVVRRLTPTECERLQGMPDDHTLVPYRGKPADKCPDGPRYKAVGNSMAVPVMRWIGERIQAVDEIMGGNKMNEQKREVMPGDELFSVVTGMPSLFRRRSRRAMDYMATLDGLRGVHIDPSGRGTVWFFATENDAKRGRNMARSKGIQCGDNICRWVVAADGVPELDEQWARDHVMAD